MVSMIQEKRAESGDTFKIFFRISNIRNNFKKNDSTTGCKILEQFVCIHVITRLISQYWTVTNWQEHRRRLDCYLLEVKKAQSCALLLVSLIVFSARVQCVYS